MILRLGLTPASGIFECDCMYLEFGIKAIASTTPRTQVLNTFVFIEYRIIVLLRSPIQSLLDQGLLQGRNAFYCLEGRTQVWSTGVSL